MKSIIAFYFLLAVLPACTSSKTTKSVQSSDKELEDLSLLMTGKFSSAAQAKKDSAFYDISLIMTPIWTDRTDGKWLYVEQAAASTLNKPYRQRVYRLQHPGGDRFTSDIYTIKNEQAFVGLQDDKAKQDKLTFDLIELKEGCTVTLVRRNGVYEGGTTGANCPSDLRGAKYATTKIVLKEGELMSWDQGFDVNGKQVWGATKGGYIFSRN